MAIKPILFSTPMVQAILEGRKTQTRRIQGLDSKNEFPDVWNRKGDPRQTKNRIWDSSKEKNPNPISIEFGFRHNEYPDGDVAYMKSRVKPGDILWVRETWCLTQPFGPEDYHFGYRMGEHSSNKASEKYDYSSPNVWKPSIHMPKEACRIFLEVTNVRVERLQDISEQDAIAEGIELTDDYWGADGSKNYMYGEEKGFKHEFFFADGLYGIEKTPSVNGIISSFFTLIASLHSWELLQSNPWVWVYDFKRTEEPENFLK